MTKQEEFELLLRTYGDMAYRMALHLAHGREDVAGDLVQDAFVRIWRYWSFQKPDHFKSWMYRILRNLYVDHCRREARRPHVSLDEHAVSSDGLTWADQLAESAPQVVAVLETQEAQFEVQSALRRLPDEFRMPVVLCDMEGMTYDDIARVMACPVGTVRSRIHRGRELLKRALGHLRFDGAHHAEGEVHHDL